MESIQQFELILMSKMDASPSQCSDTEELSFGDNFANGKTFENGLKWEIKLILIFPVFRSIFEISWRLHRHWLLSRAWQGRENVHRWWVERVSRVRFLFGRLKLTNFDDLSWESSSDWFYWFPFVSQLVHNQQAFNYDYFKLHRHKSTPLAVLGSLSELSAASLPQLICYLIISSWRRHLVENSVRTYA